MRKDLPLGRSFCLGESPSEGKALLSTSRSNLLLSEKSQLKSWLFSFSDRRLSDRRKSAVIDIKEPAEKLALFFLAMFWGACLYGKAMIE